MANVSKKLLLFSCLFIFCTVFTKHKTKKLQLLVAPLAPSYLFALNAGNGIGNNPAAPRPQGAYYEITALVFPGGTVSKNQTDFSVDKHGNPINLGDNIGIAYFLETMLQTIDFESSVPVQGTVVEQSALRLQFKSPCDGDNALYAMGLSTLDNFPPQVGEPVFTFSFGVTGGSGCNQDKQKNSFTGKVYVAQSGTVFALITLKFDKEIEY